MTIPVFVRSLLSAVALTALVGLYLVNATVGWLGLGALAVVLVVQSRRAAAAAKHIAPTGTLT